MYQGTTSFFDCGLTRSRDVDSESGRPSHGWQILDVHALHSRPGRPLIQRALEPIHPGLVALGLRLDATVREIAYEPAEPFARSRFLGEEPVPHALHVARDQIPPRHHHVPLRAPWLPAMPGRARLYLTERALTYLQLMPESAAAGPDRIGIDLGGTKIEAAALSPDGVILARHRVPTPRDDYHGTLMAIAGLVERLEQSIGRAVSVGVGIPGTLSPATGLVKNANSVWLIGRPLADDLPRVLGRPVRFENDANCFALSEARDGAGQGCGLVFGVILGTGTGGGIVVDGHLYRGRNAIGGEWGHNPLPWPGPDEYPGPRCYCGKTGCIETFLSGPGLAADHARTTGQWVEPARIVALATAGNAAAEATLARYDDRLARALASLINVLDPDVIVLGGGLSNLDRLYKAVPHLWGKYVFSDQVDTPLVPPAHGDSSGVRGAAWLWET